LGRKGKNLLCSKSFHAPKTTSQQKENGSLLEMQLGNNMA